MELKISKTNFLNVLNKVIGVIPKKSNHPILSNVLLEIDSGLLYLTATNTEMEIQVKTELESEHEDFITTLPATKLFEIVKSMPDKTEMLLDYRKDIEQCNIQGGKSRFTLNALPADEFPRINFRDDSFNININQQIFGAALQQVSFAMAKGDVRQFFNGMLFDFDTDSLNLVATDGHRLSKCNIAIKTPELTNKEFIVPSKSVDEIEKLAKDINNEDTELNLGFSDNSITLNLENVKFVSKLIEGKFPQYKEAIPRNNNKILLVSNESLLDSLQRVSIVTRIDKLQGVKLNLENDNLMLFCRNNDNDTVNEELKVSYQDEPFQVGFNVNYLRDMLKVTPENVEIKFKDAQGSALISYRTNNCLTEHVIMPTKV